MNRIVSVIVLVLLHATVWACDICGSGPGNNYVGILPEYNQKIVGVRYRANSMMTHVGVGGVYTPLTTKESFKTIEAWGAWNIDKKWRLMASIPYVFTEKLEQGATQDKNGIGDISFSGQYNLMNTQNTIINKKGKSKLLVQSLWIGAGIKLASGMYDSKVASNTTNEMNLYQLGTGSYDANFLAMYDIRWQDVGLNINGNYKLNTANKDAYKYGNKLNISSQVYHKFLLKKNWNISPNMGWIYERSQLDNDDGLKVFASGGNANYGTIGLESMYKKMAIGFNYQTPLSQNIAKGIVQAKDRYMVHIALLF